MSATGTPTKPLLERNNWLVAVVSQNGFTTMSSLQPIYSMNPYMIGQIPCRQYDGMVPI
jgi:hypothetical protein